MFMLDTNVCIDFALGRSDLLRARVRQFYNSGLSISAITLAELKVGARHPKADPDDQRRLDVLIGTLNLHDFDGRAADDYGALAREVGVKRASFDRLIAAHARSLDLTLVTNNPRDFADVQGLRIENWCV